MKSQYNQGDVLQNIEMTKNGLVKRIAVIIRVFSEGAYHYYDMAFLTAGKRFAIDITHIDGADVWTLLVRGQ
jgi:hypothetical protein